MFIKIKIINENISVYVSSITASVGLKTDDYGATKAALNP